MDYLLAAHIRVTGGEAAVAEFRKVEQAQGQLGKSTSSQAGTGITAGLKEAEGQAGRLQSAVGRVGDAMIRMATYTGISAVAAGFYQAAKGVLEFDSAMTESLAIQGQAAVRMRGQMEDLAKTIAVDLGMAPKDVAEGFYFLASAGLNVNQQLSALPQVAAFAKAGMMDLEDATEMTFDALSALGLKSLNPQIQLQNLTRLTDVLSRAAVDSQGTIEQFGDAIANKAGSSMKNFGIPMEEGVALLEVFADQGIKGKVAGERMNMVIRDMALKSLKNADAWKAMGIEVYDSSGNFNSILGIFKQIDKALTPLTAEDRVKALSALGFTLRDVSTIQSVLFRSDDLARYAERNFGALGTTVEIAGKQMDSLQSRLNQLKAVTIVLAIEGWEGLQRAGAWLLDTFEPAILRTIDVLGLMAQGAAPIAQTLGEIGGGLVIGGLTTLASVLESTFGFLAEHETAARGLGAAVAAIAGAHAIGGLASLAGWLAGPLIGQFGAAALAARKFVAEVALISALNGPLAGIRAVIGGIVTALTSPVAVGAGVIFMLDKVRRENEDLRTKGRSAIEEYLKPFSTATFTGTQQAIDALKFKITELKEASKEGTSFFPWEHGEAREASAALGEAEAALASFEKQLRSFSTSGEIGRAFQTAGMTAGAQAFKGMLDIVGAGIDPLNPKLGDLAAAMDAVRGATEEAPKPTSWQQAMETIRSAAANAEEKLQALNTLMEGMDKGGAGVLGGEVNFVEALGGLGEALQKNKDSGHEFFTLLNESGRDATKSLLGARSAAIELATAVGGEQGLNAGAAALQGYADQIRQTMANAGVAEPVIDQYLSRLGLTPAQIETLIKLTMEGKNPEEIDAALNELDGKTAKTTVEIEAKGMEIAKGISDKSVTMTVDVIMNGLTAALTGVEEVTAPRDQTTTVETPNSDAEATALDIMAHPRDQPTTVLTPNKDAKDTELTDVARRRDSDIWVGLPNKDGANSELNAVANAVRTAVIGTVANTSTAAAQLAALVNQTRTAVINVSTVIGSAVVGKADGGIVESYAGGGLKESHIAQIAPAGAWRLWAEPETGGEAYIPLGQGKRDQSTAIWEEVGRRFGISGGNSTAVTMAPNINIKIDGAGHLNPEALAQAVRAEVVDATTQGFNRLMVELRSMA